MISFPNLVVQGVSVHTAKHLVGLGQNPNTAWRLGFMVEWAARGDELCGIKRHLSAVSHHTAGLSVSLIPQTPKHYRLANLPAHGVQAGGRTAQRHKAEAPCGPKATRAGGEGGCGRTPNNGLSVRQKLTLNPSEQYVFHHVHTLLSMINCSPPLLRNETEVEMVHTITKEVI